MTKVLVLLVLLAAGEAHFALATLDIVWRTFVLSFDSPASQWTDAIASDSSLSSDVGREAREAVRYRPGPQRLCAVRARPSRDCHWLGSRLTRSPPSSIA